MRADLHRLALVSPPAMQDLHITLFPTVQTHVILAWQATVQAGGSNSHVSLTACQISHMKYFCGVCLSQHRASTTGVVQWITVMVHILWQFSSILVTKFGMRSEMDKQEWCNINSNASVPPDLCEEEGGTSRSTVQLSPMTMSFG